MADRPTTSLRFLHPTGEPTQGKPFPPDVQAVLDAINQKVAAAQSLTEVMDFFFDASIMHCDCDRIGVAFFEEDGHRIVAYWVRALYEPILLGKGYAEDLEGSSLQRVLEKREPRIIDDLEAYLSDHPNSRSTAILVREGVRSSMTCPLIVEDRVVGLLFRSSRKVRSFGEMQLDMHLAVAERLSQAVEKVWRIEQLDAANRAYTEMLGFVSHELKNPIASMVMDAKLLVDGYLGDLTGPQRDKLERQIKKGEYLLNLVREYLDLARMEGGDLRVNLQNIGDLTDQVITPALDLVQPQVDAKSMQVVVDAPQGLSWILDPDLLKIALVNLLGNAVKYGFEYGEIRLKVTLTDFGMQIAIRNDGPGFPDAERSKLFRRFSRLASPNLTKQAGTGVGLYTVWKIVQLHHGKIHADSEPGVWAEFIIDLPKDVVSSEL